MCSCVSSRLFSYTKRSSRTRISFCESMGRKNKVFCDLMICYAEAKRRQIYGVTILLLRNAPYEITIPQLLWQHCWRYCDALCINGLGLDLSITIDKPHTQRQLDWHWNFVFLRLEKVYIKLWNLLNSKLLLALCCKLSVWPGWQMGRTNMS